MSNRILIVDDDADMVELLRFNLKSAGFSIGTASNGLEGLVKARSLRPDLILLDIMMPELDGFAVCEMLRRDRRMPAIPILMLTAWPGELGRLAGLECGATDYVNKPFNMQSLLARVSGLLLTADGAKEP